MRNCDHDKTQRNSRNTDANCDLHFSNCGLVLRIEIAPTVVTQPSRTNSALITTRAVSTETSSHARSIDIVWTSRKYGSTAKNRKPHAKINTAGGANAFATVSRRLRIISRNPRVLVAIHNWIVTSGATTPISR